MKIKIPSNLSVHKVFFTARYKKHPKGNGFIRELKHGRFHAVYQGGKEFDLHFDIYGQNGHWAPYMPYTCGRETAKILGICKTLGGIHLIRKEKKPKDTMQTGEVVLTHHLEAKKKAKENKKIKEKQRRLRKKERLNEIRKILYDTSLTADERKSALALVDN